MIALAKAPPSGLNFGSHGRKVCVKKIFKLDVTIAGLAACRIQVSQCGGPVQRPVVLKCFNRIVQFIKRNVLSCLPMILSHCLRDSMMRCCQVEHVEFLESVTSLNHPVIIIITITSWRHLSRAVLPPQVAPSSGLLMGMFMQT